MSRVSTDRPIDRGVDLKEKREMSRKEECNMYRRKKALNVTIISTRGVGCSSAGAVQAGALPPPVFLRHDGGS